jgi:putative peptide zinc metalloprotease protein
MSRIPFRQTVMSVVALTTTVLLLTLVHIDDRVTGPFLLKTQEQIKVYAPVAGFVKSLECREGDELKAGAIMAQLEIPDLVSRMTQKRAEVKEAEAVLHMLTCGVRPEELAEQGERLARAHGWRDKAYRELKNALREDEQQIASKVEEYRRELEFARQTFDRSRELYGSKVLSSEALERAEKEFHVKQAQINQAIAEQSARQASIVLHAESELVDRERELAEARATLNLMEAGTRPEMVDAKRAELERLRAELAYLERLEIEQSVICPIDGVIATPDLETLTGAYLREGDLFCELVAPSKLTVEISLREKETARVQLGHRIEIKARSLPFQTINTTVDRIAPIVDITETESRVRVFCRLQDPPTELRPGMSGFARVYLGRRPVGSVILDRVIRFLRFEFWW